MSLGENVMAKSLFLLPLLLFMFQNGFAASTIYTESFDSAHDGGQTGWAFIKKVGATWKFWDENGTTPSWVALPRAISNYTVNTIIFINDGTSFKSRSGPQLWPEAFP